MSKDISKTRLDQLKTQLDNVAAQVNQQVTQSESHNQNIATQRGKLDTLIDKLKPIELEVTQKREVFGSKTAELAAFSNQLEIKKSLFQKISAYLEDYNEFPSEVVQQNITLLGEGASQAQQLQHLQQQIDEINLEGTYEH